ncbi:molybdopterin-binding protein [Selenomonas sp. TAMA-11512]|uniref:molybdopterin-binding protein n=1 Tax=Selenomonas sp. TAMA-11512 TaxID=3095337 RepID=UPI0030907642|nr:molybdopterin-binding protein [Selenomonas sp. TAMA-11512]
MQEVRTEDSVGRILCHDLTQIIRGVTKDARFRKGHVVQKEDIPILLSMGKEHLYVWEEDAAMLHEEDAAAILRDLCLNAGMSAGEPKEGKIEIKAEIDGVFYVDRKRFQAVNMLPDMSMATIPQYMPVKKGTKLAGMRIVPLMIEKERMEQVKRVAGKEPLFTLRPYKAMKVGVVTTGSEVAKGLINDGFTPVLAQKLKAFGLAVDAHRISDDGIENTKAAILELLDLGMDMILCTGGMSVDPDDRTPAAIRDSGAEVVSYGAPILPGAMFLVAYMERDDRVIPILGLPGCVMFETATVFDIFLPRILTGERLRREDIVGLGIGGLCMHCRVCHFPVCGFGKE